MNIETKFLIVVVGPTAIGKTNLSLFLAERLQTEIVSADSRQFFRELRIGTAKPSEAELAAVRHHLVNSLSIHNEYNAGKFEQDALDALKKIFENHEVAIMCGGSGLYIRMVCSGSDELPPKNDEIRNSLVKLYRTEGVGALQKQLFQLDAEYYHQVDLHNPHRLIRALEVCLSTGKKYSGFRQGKIARRPFNTIKIGIEEARDEVYRRINERVDKMVEEGLVEEAREFYPYRNLNSLRTHGYQEIFEFLDGRISREEAIALVKQHTRNYAKRQWTWFKRDKEITWFRSHQREEIFTHINELMAGEE